MSYSPQTWDGYYSTIERPLAASGHFHYLISMHAVEAKRVMELGVGTGTNIPFLLNHYHCDYYGIEGSRAAVDAVIERIPDLRGHIYCGDFTVARPFRAGFDLVVDRASLAHNGRADIQSCLDIVWDMLVPGGLFIASDWFSTSHSEYDRGQRLESDKYGATLHGFEDGQFVGLDKVHFSAQEELEDLFQRFDGIAIEERIVRRPAPNRLVERVIGWPWVSREFDRTEYRAAFWDVVVRKPL